jgi:hypothetical protein
MGVRSTDHPISGYSSSMGGLVPWLEGFIPPTTSSTLLRACEVAVGLPKTAPLSSEDAKPCWSSTQVNRRAWTMCQWGERWRSLTRGALDACPSANVRYLVRQCPCEVRGTCWTEPCLGPSLWSRQRTSHAEGTSVSPYRDVEHA